jgi:hypothetical protein
LFTDVSGQHIGPTFKGQESEESLEDETDTVSQNVGKQLPHDATYIPEECRSHGNDVFARIFNSTISLTCHTEVRKK